MSISSTLSTPRRAARSRGRLSNLVEGVRITLEACEDAFAAVSMYQELSALSDAELERRGVPRQHLFRLVFDRLTRQ